MSSMAFGGGNIAGVARVAFETTGVAETNRDIDLVQRNYTSGTKDMSDAAIRFQLAEDRLQRALRKGPSNYRAIASAELSVRRARSELERETRQLDRTEDRRARNLGRMRGSLAAYTAGYIGTTGLILAIRSSLAAAREEELVLGQTRIAVEAAGLEWERYADRIETVIRAQSRLGFDDEQLLKTFSVFIRRTRDVDEALRLNALSADVARARYIDLETAQNIVLKASIGMGGQLRRLGLDVDKNATSTELLTFLTRNYGRAAEDAATTGTAAQDRWNVAIENTKEALGRGLLPTVTEYTDALIEWLDTADNQEELQRRVNDAVEKGETVVRGIGGAFEYFNETLIEPLEKLGLLEEAITAALIIGIVGKTRRAAASFGLIAAASQVTTAKVVRDAAIAGAALDTAYRPRAVPVTVVPGGGGRGGRGAFPIFGGPAGALIVGGLAIDAATGGKASDPSGLDILNSVRGSGEGPTLFEFFLEQARRGRLNLADARFDALTPAQRRTLTRLNRQARRTGRDPFVDREDRGAAAKSGAASGERPPPRTGRGGRRPRTLLDIEVDLARALMTQGTGDEEILYREQVSLFQAQIDALERRKNLTKKQKEELARLYGQLGSAQSALDAIQEAEEQRIADAREKARERREREREARERRERQRFERFERRTRAGDLRRAKRTDLDPAIAAALRSRGVDPKTGKKIDPDDSKGLTEADVRRMQFEFLASLTGEIGRFGSTFSPDDGQLVTNAHLQTHLLRGQNMLLERLAEAGWHPGAQVASAELTAAGWGVGF